jgi:nucleotidyltransferase substrate binding protein (TIGR01987 family)
MMEPTSAIRLRQFDRALQRLQEAVALPVDSIVRDACIQRFEFTFETAWKAIQADARVEGVDCASPRDCFRAAFRLGMLGDDEPDWLRMVEDRNRTSHTYDEEVAAEIYKSLSGCASLVAVLLAELEKRAQRREQERAEGSGQ